MHYQNDTFLFLLQEVSLKYHKSSIKYHKSSIKAALKLHNEAPKVPLSSNATTYKRKRLRVYTIVVFSFIRTFAPSF